MPWDAPVMTATLSFVLMTLFQVWRGPELASRRWPARCALPLGGRIGLRRTTLMRQMHECLGEHVRQALCAVPEKTAPAGRAGGFDVGGLVVDEREIGRRQAGAGLNGGEEGRVGLPAAEVGRIVDGVEAVAKPQRLPEV